MTGFTENSKEGYSDIYSFIPAVVNFGEKFDNLLRIIKISIVIHLWKGETRVNTFHFIVTFGWIYREFESCTIRHFHFYPKWILPKSGQNSITDSRFLIISIVIHFWKGGKAPLIWSILCFLPIQSIIMLSVRNFWISGWE